MANGAVSMVTRLGVTAAGVITLALSVGAGATPLALEGRTITGAPVAATDPAAVFEYDPNLNITWLRNWNVNSAQTWTTQVAWAAGLTVGTFTGWRLPFITDTGTPGCDFSYSGGTDCGYNVQTASGSTVYSEMAYLWYDELGNLAYCPPGNATCTGAGVPQSGWGLMNTGPFENMQPNQYWSGTEYAPDTRGAWVFNTLLGFQGLGGKLNPSYAVAVRPGDVAAAIPEPGTLMLLLGAAGALAAIRRRRPG